MELAPGYRVTPKVTLVRPLGKGAMGSVWVAEHSTLDTEVAVKFITDEFQSRRSDAIERFRREATGAARIKSPHVVQMLDHGVTDDGTPYIVMEHLEGETLADCIKRDGQLSLRDTGQVVVHVSRALTAAHKLGVIHRDIKPQNIFINHIHGELFAKVLDFGIAKQPERRGEELTEPGTLVGTPEYLSRDLIAVKGAQADEQVDHWALAVVAYKCLTGKIPFSGDTIALVLAALAIGKFDPPSSVRPELPDRVDRWFARAFHEDPTRRFGTAEELAMSFAAIVNPGAAPWDHKETQVRPRVTPAAPEKKGIPIAIPITVVASLAVGVAIAMMIDRAGHPPVAPPLPSAGVADTEPADGGPPDAAVPSPPPVVDAGPVDAAVAEPTPKAPPGETYIPAGGVWLGCYAAMDGDCEDDERPGKRVSTAAFFLDEREVTVAAYEKCATARVCRPAGLSGFALQGGQFGLSSACNWGRSERANHPLNCVTWNQAADYCRWAGKRLPTEVEWERAARGDDRRIFPWGDDYADCDHAAMGNCKDAAGTWEAGSQVNDKGPFGNLDLAGNVREWTASWYDEHFYKMLDIRKPTAPTEGERRAARGGSWGNAVHRFLRVSERDAFEPETRSVYLGFRCARDIDALPAENDAGAGGVEGANTDAGAAAPPGAPAP